MIIDAKDAKIGEIYRRLNCAPGWVYELREKGAETAEKLLAKPEDRCNRRNRRMRQALKAGGLLFWRRRRHKGPSNRVLQRKLCVLEGGDPLRVEKALQTKPQKEAHEGPSKPLVDWDLPW